MFSISAIVLLSVAVYLFYKYFAQDCNKRLPPGPFGFPIVGNILSLARSKGGSWKVFDRWGQKYGPIVGARLGFTKVVILNDAKIIREAFTEHCFSGRPANKLMQVLSNGPHGVIHSNGGEWIEQRRFTLKNLRDFGFGKKSMETGITDEVNEFINWINKHEDTPVSVNKKFSLAVLNALWMIIAGQRYEHDDPYPNNILNQANQVLDGLMEKEYLIFFPELLEWFPNWFGFNELLEVFKPLLSIFEGAVEDHEQNPAEENSPRDFIDVYLSEIRKTTDPNSSFYKEAGRHSLVTVVGDLYGAGSGTTSTTLTWSILYLMTHPEVQAKLQKELDAVIGKNRHPTLADRPNTPYTEAVISEILRFSNIVPMGVFHTALEDTTLQGYFIEKGTMIIANHHTVHFDKTVWGDPENFRPERFLSADEKQVKRVENLIPFSIGRRQCLGESLARDTSFLFLTSIFKRFQVLPDPKAPNPTFEPDIGFILEPKQFTVIFKDRSR